MPETYYESAEDIEISAERARKEIMDHGGNLISWYEFVRDVGIKRTYMAQDVLDWLGY